MPLDLGRPSPTGVGIGLRAPHVQDLLRTERHVDFLEIIPENYVGRGGETAQHLDACLERWPVLAHGVSVSVGGPDPLDRAYLAELRTLLQRIRAPFYTDHLCYTTVGGFQSHQLLPLPFHNEAVHHAATRIRALRDLLGLPIAVENISYYAIMPGSDMAGVDFVAAVCEEADCGLLLDINNLYVNARNHGLDPVACLDRLPLDRVLQIHIAGHEVRDGRWIDNHGAPVDDAVLELFLAARQRLHDVPVLLERDLNLPPLADVLDEADALRAAAIAPATREVAR